MAHGHGQRAEKTTGGPVDNRKHHASIMAKQRRTRGAFDPTDADPINEPHRVLAEAHRDMGDLATVEQKARQALESARAHEDVRFEISALSVLGTVHTRQGEGEQGLAELARALELAGEIEDPRAKAETHLSLADSHARLGACDEAVLHLDDARDLARQMRSGMLERQCRRAMATIEAILAQGTGHAVPQTVAYLDHSGLDVAPGAR